MRIPRLSIIIPTFNERQNVNPLLDLLFQRTNEIEVVIVDSKLTDDGTLSMISRPDVVKVSSRHASRAAQMHEGAEHATADIFYFLHADTRPPQDFLALIEAALEQGNDFGLFSYRFDSDSKLLAINSKFTQKDGVFTGGGDQGLFIRKSAYFEYGGFKTSLPIMEDFEFFWRLKENGLPFTIIPKKVVVSARKYARNSYFKVQLVNLITLLGFKSGREPKKLKTFYTRMLG